MKKKCPNCRLVNFAAAESCLRCRHELIEISTFETNEPKTRSFSRKLLARAASFLAAVFIALFGFYLTLLVSSERLRDEERQTIERAILILEARGFSTDVFLLRYATAYRRTDHWLNASLREGDAYAATNFPFEIMTIYPDFYLYSKDDVERAAILLHEARHLRGADEREAYIFVWQNRRKLGWTKETHGGSIVWRNVRKQTREVAPELFVCPKNEFDDCTE